MSAFAPLTFHSQVLLSQLQLQCYLSKRLLRSCRSTSTTAVAAPRANPTAQSARAAQSSAKLVSRAPTSKAFTPNPQGPGDPSENPKPDDDKFDPKPLDRPLGQALPPQAGENTGIDTRTLRQRRDDLVDYDKHIQRRKELTAKMARPYYRDWKNMRHAEGKTFIAPTKLFRADRALYFPNLQGTTLAEPRDAQDTTPTLQDRISILSLYSGDWAMKQAHSFTHKNAELDALLNAGNTPLQKVELNVEQTALKAWMIRLFLRGLRKRIPEDDHDKYFMVRRGLEDDIKVDIGVVNNAVGYTYLVDPQCRIRWAASANAGPEEKQSLVKGARRLVHEYHKALGEAGWKERGFDHISLAPPIAPG